jgi:excisionase family DNA binding protein
MHQLLTVSAVAERLSVSARTVAREVAAGTLATIRIRGAVRIAEPDLEAYIARLRRIEQWPSTSEGTAGTTASSSAADNIRDRLERALEKLRRSSLKPGAARMRDLLPADRVKDPDR